MGLLHRSMAGAVLILAVVAVRALALNRLPKAAFKALWAVAVARLLLPFSIPSRFSLYNLVARLAAGAQQEPAGSRGLGAGLGSAGALSGSLGNGSMPAGTMTESLAKRSGALVSAPEVCYLLGVCLVAVCFLASYISCRKKFRVSLPVGREAVGAWLKGKRRRPRVRVLDQISVPLTYGVVRPVILLPKKTDWEDERALGYILDHEYVHILHFDAFNKIILAVALCVHWFNPLVWVMYFLANRDMELYCDETVVRMGQGTARESYALALLRMEELKKAPFSLYSHFGGNAMEERIVAIMKIKKNSVVGIVFAAALVAGTATLFATSALAKDEAGQGDNPSAKADGNPAAWLAVTPTPLPGEEGVTGNGTALDSGVLVTPLPEREGTDGWDSALDGGVLVTPLPEREGADGWDAAPGSGVTPTLAPDKGEYMGGENADFLGAGAQQLFLPGEDNALRDTDADMFLGEGIGLWDTETNTPIFVRTKEEWEQIRADVESGKIKRYTMRFQTGEDDKSGDRHAGEVIDEDGSVLIPIYSQVQIMDEEGNVLTSGYYTEFPGHNEGTDANSETDYYMETDYYLQEPDGTDAKEGGDGK